MKTVFPATGELALRDHFRGRRAGPRAHITLDVAVLVNDATLAARTIDVSRSGILLQLDPTVFADSKSLMDLTSTLGALFGRDSVKIRLPGRMTRAVRLVRVTMGGLGGSAVPLVACRFLKDLSKRQYQRLVAAR